MVFIQLESYHVLSIPSVEYHYKEPDMPAVGTLLSEYRKRSRLSQLELSLLADVSSRHISFIETGRSQPSRSMLLRLAEVLDLPHRDSNLLLNSGGFSPAYSDLQADAGELEPIRQALNLILENHNPYPALVMDSNYNLLMSNAAQIRLTGGVFREASQPTSNLLEAVFRPDLFRPFLGNWNEVAGHMLRRLRRQILAYDRPEHHALMARLLAMDPPQDWQAPDEHAADGPMLTIDYLLGDSTLKLFTTLTQFGTALDTGVEEILIESYFPADEATRRFFTQTQS